MDILKLESGFFLCIFHQLTDTARLTFCCFFAILPISISTNDTFASVRITVHLGIVRIGPEKPNPGSDFRTGHTGVSIKDRKRIFAARHSLGLVGLKSAVQPTTLKKRPLIKSSRRLITRYGLVAVNILVIATAGYLVFSDRPKANDFTNQVTNARSETATPIDTVAAADIAANVAIATQLPIAVIVSNQADSVKTISSLASSDESSVIKPQVISTGDSSLGSGDIISYVVVSGDTMSSISQKFNIPSQSIRDSNNLSSDRLTLGRTLILPPKNRTGIVYKVNNGDTPKSLASRFSAAEEKIISFNDAEVSGLTTGSYIFIPDGKKQAPVAVTGSLLFSNAIYGGNSYAPGYCTWYVASRVSVPSNWGNANTWDNKARQSGWTVSSVPVPGAIAQSDSMSWWGHVAIVESVSADGTMIEFSDMNGIAGFGRVGFSGMVSAAKFQNFIYR